MVPGLRLRLAGLGWRREGRELAAALAGPRPRIVHAGGYWRGENDIVRQMMRALAESGAQVHEIDTDRRSDLLAPAAQPYDRGTSAPVWLRLERLGPELLRLRPDAIVCNAGGLAFRPGDARWLRRRTALLGIALSDPDVFASTTSRIAGGFDLFLSNAPDCLERYRALGIAAEELPLATHPGYFQPEPPDPLLACDVLVVGRAHDDRVAPVRALAERFRVHVHGELWSEHGVESRGFLHGRELRCALGSAAVTVVFGRSLAGLPQLKPQIFDFVASGALVLAERSPGLARYLEPGRELAVFGSTAELLEQVQSLLDDPARAARLRAAGRARVLAEHSWVKLWPRLLQRLGERKAGVRPSDGAR